MNMCEIKSKSSIMRTKLKQKAVNLRKFFSVTFSTVKQNAALTKTRILFYI